MRLTTRSWRLPVPAHAGQGRGDGAGGTGAAGDGDDPARLHTMEAVEAAIYRLSQGTDARFWLTADNSNPESILRDAMQ